MLNLGHNHPDFIYPNDQESAKLAILGSMLAAIIASILIVMTVLR